jgi:hypothetical protein
MGRADPAQGAGRRIEDGGLGENKPARASGARAANPAIVTGTLPESAAPVHATRWPGVQS